MLLSAELPVFINFCTNRQSPWGGKDANILSALQTDFGLVGNNLYFVNDIVDVVNAAEDIANEAWATGTICMNSADNPRWESEFKYYQRYIEDMRILTSTEGDERVQTGINPVLAYLEEYDTKHPQDNSFTGMLARISGQTKDDIAMMLEFVDYSTKIANYTPATRYDFGLGMPELAQISFTETILPNTSAIAYRPDKIFIDTRKYTV